MSKVIKQMQMNALEQCFGDVRDMVVLSIVGLNSNDDNALRAELANKDVQLFMVKNSFARKVFDERMEMEIPQDSPYWEGPTFLAFGCESPGELSRVIDNELTDKKKAAKYRKTVTIKGAIVEGKPISFDIAKKMPTREEAIANVIGLALAPAMRLVGQISGPGTQLAGQFKTLSEEEAS